MDERDTIRQLQLFSGKSRFFFVYKKTERLVSAIYLVTDLISDREPIKWSLRNLGNNLLSEVLSFVFNYQSGFRTYSESRSDIFEIQSLFLETSSLFEIGYISGQISPMNHKLIKNELFALIKILDEYAGGEKSNSKSIALPLDFFDLGEDIKDIEKDTNIDMSFMKSPLLSKGQGDQLMDKRPTYDMSLKKYTNLKNSNNNKTVENKRSSRKESIVTILKLSKGQGLTIKDISMTFSDCSEKTVQRELISLIKDNIVKKEGERRWSKYYLI